MLQRIPAPASVDTLLAGGAPAFGGIFAAATDQVIENYIDRQSELVTAQAAIVALAESEQRQLTAEESRQLDGLQNEYDMLAEEIERRNRFLAQQEALARPRGRVSEPDESGTEPAPAAATTALPAPRATVPARPLATPRGTGGFRSFGEFAAMVHRASRGITDQRLTVLNAQGANEGTGGEGGFLVPVDFRNEIMSRVFSEASLVSLTDPIRSNSNAITIPVDVTTPWQSSGGVQAYWTGEGQEITKSRPVFQEVTVKAHKLACLIPVTEELAEDATSLDAYLRRQVPAKMDFKISDAIVRGDGVGKPLGFLNSPALVTQPAEPGPQTADTIVAANIAKMFARMPAESRSSAVWIIHPDAEPQLHLMTLGNQPIYAPPGGFSNSPYGTLLGRPVIPHQVAATVGDVGDIMFIDPRQYLTLLKVGGGRDASGLRAEVSMHLYFDTDELAYKFTIRLGGQPWFASSIEPRSGTFNQSPFVVLAAR